MDKIQARTKVKTHIRRIGGSANFHITPQLILFWWNILNHAVFDGKLIQPRRFEIRNFRDCFGWCRGFRNSNEVVMGIRREFDDRKFFLTILSHEMVHQYEHQMLGRMTHGQAFHAWAGRLKRTVGIHLTEYVETHDL